MKPDTSGMDSAFPVMAVDILSNVLSRADNPGNLGTYLTEEVRDLTGARCVLLIQCLSTPTVTAHRVVSVNPLRRREWAESPDGNRLYDIVHRVVAAQLWRGEEPSEVAGLLRREGFELSMVFPLNVGGSRVGAMLVLGLPDEEHITSVLSLVNDLSTIMALVLRNATFYEKQEQLIQERTAELRDNNEKLAVELAERKQAVQRIAQLAAIVESSDDAIIGKTLEGIITSWNKGAEKIYGYAENEILGRSVSVLVPPGNADEVSDILVGIEHGEHIEHYETVRRRKDGQLVHVSLTISPVLDTEGRIIGASTISRDITQRKLAEGALKNSERRLADIVDMLPDATIAIDLEGTITIWNRTAEEFTGVKAESMLGKGDFEYAVPFYGARRPMLLDLVLHSSEETEKRYSYVKKEGKTVIGEGYTRSVKRGEAYMFGIAAPLYDSKGTVIGAIESVRDITDRKRAEEALNRLNRELQAISTCNQTLMRAVDEQTLLNDICRIVCDKAGYRLAWVGYAEHDDAKTVHPVAWAGLDSGYIANARLTWADDTERGQGPAGKAIRSGEAFCVQDFATDPQVAPWRESALLHGYRSGIALPLKDEHANAFGVLLIYSAEINAITPDEIRLLEELSGDLAFGIITLRTRAERKRTECVNMARLRLLQFAAVHTLDELLQATLDEAEELSGSLISFYHFLEADQKTLSLQNWSTRTKAEFCKAEGKGQHYDVSEAGVWVDCIHERRAVIHNDYASLSHRKGMPPGHAPVVRELVVPVFRGEKIVAILGVGNKPQDYTPQDVEAVSLLADLAWEIVERNRTEEALKQSKDKYRMLTESIKDVVWTLDTETMRFLYVSPSVQGILGYTPEEVMAHSIDAILTPEGAATMRQEMQGELEDFMSGKATPDTFYTAEVEQPRKDGLKVWAEMITSYYRDEQTGHICVRGVSRDITDRRKIASDLATSRTALLEAQTIAHIGDWSMDAATRTFAWSDELYAIHGVQPGTPMAHSTYLELIHPEDRKRVLEVLQSGMAGRAQEFTVDYRMMRPDKVERFLTLTGKTLSDDSGRLTGLRGTLQDITERRRAEAEKEAMQAQLLQSQKMRAIGELAGGVAHDFNNLLTGILGNAALVRDALPPGDPLRENLSLAAAAARQAADLTRGLLTFSRSAVIAPTPVCVNDAVETALSMLRQSLPATIDIRCQFEPVAWNVLMDQSQMTQIILNLGINARDAMDGKGTIIITTRNVIIDSDYVRTHPDAHAGEHVLLRVSDTGPGLAPEVLEHMFEPFFTTKPDGQGTGLGLPIVYGAATQAGGWITTESLPDLGATFDIYLPRSLDVTTKQRPTSVPSSQPRHGGTILVVEDEPVVATVTQRLLTRSGYTVLMAAEGNSAIDIVRSKAPGIDLILLDMTMPGMTTQEIIPALRALSPSVPILLTSGYTSSDIVTRMLEEGSVQGFLPKPYEPGELLSTVARLMHTAGGGPQ